MSWQDKLYFDNEIKLENLRFSQLNLAYKIIFDYSSYFSQDRNLIGNYIYNLIWIVAGGKTLAIPAISFAYSAMMRSKFGLHTKKRVSRILVLAKERSIRDQLYRDLTDGMSEKEVCCIPLRAKLIDEGKFLDNLDNLNDYDACFACIQQLFDKKGNGGRSEEEIRAILDSFELIFVDEPHFAPEQVNRIVSHAKNSLVFGLTGTPFNCDGEILKRQICYSLYDYDSANINDHSLKYVPESLFDYVDIIDIHEADMQKGGQKWKTKNANEHGYSYGSVPVTTVAESVIAHLKKCDEIAPLQIANFEIAPHRESYKDKISELVNYKSHAIFVVDTKNEAKRLVKSLNDRFLNNRIEFPQEDGWLATIAISDDSIKSLDGNIEKIDRLNCNHPWLQAKYNDGKMVIKRGKKTIYGSRILVLVGMGKEGLDNVYCNTLGIACKKSSKQDLVQRFGRALRALLLKTKSGIGVPPRILDEIKVITHTTYYDDEAYMSAHSFILDMKSSLSDIVSIDEFINGRIPCDIDLRDDGVLSDKERFATASLVCKELKQTNSDKVDSGFVETIKVSFGDNSEHKKKQLEKWIQTIHDDPLEACKRIGIARIKLQPIPAVLNEEPNRDIADDKLLSWLMTYDEAVYNSVMKDGKLPSSMALARILYVQNFDKFKLPNNLAVTSLKLIREELRKKVINYIIGIEVNGGDAIYLKNTSAEARSNIIRQISILVNAAIKQIIGTDDPVEDEGEFNKPQYHAIFNRPHITKEVTGYVMRILASEGVVPHLGLLIDKASNQ